MTPLTSPHQEALGMRTAFARAVTVVATRGAVTVTLEPAGGSVTNDSRRAMRWNGTLNIPVEDVDLLPTLPSDLLTPFGTRIDLRLGITLADSSTADVPYGSFIVDGSSVELAADRREVVLTLVDLADILAKYRFETPLEIPVSTDLADAINTVVLDRLGLNPGLAATGSVLARARIFGLDPNLDPWRECQTLAADFGYRLFYDRNGQLVLDQPPLLDPTTATLLAGPLTVTGAFDGRPPNVIVVRGEASDDTPPVQAVTFDNDPGSPTYAGPTPGSSPYGRVTEFLASPVITTTAQAEQAGQRILAGIAAEAATWEASRPYDPTIDCDDVLQVPLTDDTSLPLGVDAITINIRGETTIACRALSQVVE